VRGSGGNHKPPTAPAESPAPKDQPPADEGKALYEQICAACHGFKGEGLPPVAPPLTNSIWVAGAEGRILRIVLHGLKGPIHVNGDTYQPPRVLPEMPPLAAMEDAQIAAVTTYIRSRWGGATNAVTPEKIAALRAETAKRDQAWTEPELLQIK
jgi:mono/diheme cytochrome c family protein